MNNVKNKNSKKSTDIWYKVLTVFVVAIFAVGLLIAILKPTGVSEYISLHTNTTIKSDNYKVNNAQMNYMVYSLYNNYYSQYSSYASAAGLDSSLPLSQQKYFGSATKSWRDQLVEEATSTMERCLILCETADKDSSFTFSDEDKKEVEDEIQALKDAAKQSDMSVNKLIRNLYGKGVTLSDIEKITEMQVKASKYATSVSESFTYVQADYDKFYSENMNDYRYADYKMYAIDADYEEDAKEDEIKKAQEEAKAAAEELKKAIEEGKSFADAVYEYEQKLKEEEKKEEEDKKDEADKKDESKSDETSAVTSADTTAPAEDDEKPEEDKKEETPKTEEKTEEELKEEIAEEILKEKVAYTEDDLGKWIFGETAPAVDSVKVIGEDDTYTVYQLVKQPYREEYKTANMYYISLNADDFEATADKKEEDIMAEALKEALDKLSAAKNGEEFTKIAEELKTQDKFKNMFISEKVENLTKDNTESALSIEEFDEWAFSDTVKAGDTKSFTSESAGYIFLYEDAGMEAWKASVDVDKRNADYEAKYKDFSATLEGTIVINEKAQKKVAA